MAKQKIPDKELLEIRRILIDQQKREIARLNAIIKRLSIARNKSKQTSPS